MNGCMFLGHIDELLRVLVNSVMVTGNYEDAGALWGLE